MFRHRTEGEFRNLYAPDAGDLIKQFGHVPEELGTGEAKAEALAILNRLESCSAPPADHSKDGMQLALLVLSTMAQQDGGELRIDRAKLVAAPLPVRIFADESTLEIVIRVDHATTSPSP